MKNENVKNESTQIIEERKNVKNESVKIIERKLDVGNLKMERRNSEDIVIHDKDKGEGGITRDDELCKVPGGRGRDQYGPRQGLTRRAAASDE